MKSKEQYLIDLKEEIDQLDKMIELHSCNQSSFMLDQYKFKKEKLMKEMQNINR